MSASGRNDACTAFFASSAMPALVEVEQVGGDLVLPVEGGAEHRRVVAVHGDEHARRRTSAGSGGSSSTSTARVAMLEVGQTSSGIRCSTRWASSSGSCTDEVPWPMRSAPRSRSASQTVCGPVVSPACGTLCSPAARAWSNTSLNCGRSTPTSGPPSPKPIRVSGAFGAARRRGVLGGGQPGLAGDVVDPAQLDAVVPLGGDPGVLDGLDVRLDRHPGLHGGPRRQRQLGVADVLRGHVGGDLVGQQPDVLGLAEQVDDREVDLDEVPEVAERVEVAQRVEVGRHGAGVARGELGDDAGRGRPDVVDVDLGLGSPATKAAYGEGLVDCAPKFGIGPDAVMGQGRTCDPGVSIPGSPGVPGYKGRGPAKYEFAGPRL